MFEALLEPSFWTQALETDLGRGIGLGVVAATLAAAAVTVILGVIAPTIGIGWRIAISITFTGILGTMIGGSIYSLTFGEGLQQGALPTVLRAVTAEPRTICAGDSVTVTWDFPSECAAGNCTPRGLAGAGTGFACESTSECGVGGVCVSGRCQFDDPQACPAGQCSSLSTVTATYGESTLIDDDRTGSGAVTFRPSESGRIESVGGRYFAGRGATTLESSLRVRILNPNEQADYGGSLRFQCDGNVTHPYVLITEATEISDSTELRELRNTTEVALEFILPSGERITLEPGESVTFATPIPYAEASLIRARETTPGISYAEECERQATAEVSLPPGAVYTAPDPFRVRYGVGCSL